MPAVDSHAVKLVENIEYGMGKAAICRNGLLSTKSVNHGCSIVFSRSKEKNSGQNMSMPSTDAKESCQSGWKMPVGLISSRTIAARASELNEFEFRRNMKDAQNAKHITAARNAGAFSGTTIRKVAAVIVHTIARPGFIRPAVLQTHQTNPITIAKFIPERQTKCSRPVLRKAL